ncbi:glycosyl transferase group 1 [Desulfofarcimen acetoxidans DSM 771]|uniref:Glycosyl transferase group 1 n=1 Tax=Desulfofarcimen acetoxidans (strain ATCC 49208 / DSM 771 / KCTC 5769 / VKM B-1644 / 5575) TaxID=485916 RepID=C8W2E2_DESAS|nr:glycosyltransferase family 4 protein [Desulfofarcimen acetoxidans]ACV63626.1 glycosyl transferase group 1 [Desulfofarcimen acetoxidans DSM 771]
MSVLIFLSSSGKGGRELNTIRLIPYLLSRGLSVRVVVLDGGGYVANRCYCTGVDCYTLGLWPGKLNFLAVCLRFFLILRKTRPDVVQVYGFLASIICRFTARLLRIKVVVGIVGAGHFIGIRPLMERITKRLVSCYTANSLAGKSRMLEIQKNRSPRIEVIYNGIPKYSVPAAEPKKIFVVGTVANLRPEKGYDVMLEALAKVKTELRDVVTIKYLIAGEGKLREELTKKINSLGLNEQVELLGMVNNVVKVLYELDLFVLPSYTEGMPNALLEAMSAGKCVIASRVGGIPEIIEDGHNGLLVEPGDPEKLCRALIIAILDSQWRKNMAVQGQKIIHEKFSLSRQVEDSIRVWTSVCQDNSREVSR